MAINWHVSREEVEQTQHEAINAYYQHALKDPSMSRKEAIQSTAQMVERHEEYMEAYDAEQAAKAQEQETGIQTESGEDMGAGQDDGGVGDGGIE